MPNCCICGDKCSGKKIIITRKGGNKNIFCKRDFRECSGKSNKFIEKKIRDNKLLLKNYKWEKKANI